MGLKLSPIITKKQITFDTLKTKRISIKVTKGQNKAISISGVGQRGLMSRQEIKQLGSSYL